MKSIFSKCYDDWGNLKENALNIAFDLGKKEGLRKGIKQGKSDAEETHKAMCDSCIHKVSKEDIDAIRADERAKVLDECKQIMKDYTSAFVGTYYYNLLIDKFEQLNEQNDKAE